MYSQPAKLVPHPDDVHAQSHERASRNPTSRPRRVLLVTAIIALGLIAMALAVSCLITLLVDASENAVVVTGNSVSDVRRFSTMPADDGGLEAWLRAQPNVQDVSIRRVGDSGLQVTLQYLPTKLGDPKLVLSPPWENLGYQLSRGADRSLYGPGALPGLRPLPALRE